MLRSFITLAILCGIVQHSFAQDISPSQFFSYPLSNNPANTGLINSNVRVVANYSQMYTVFTPGAERHVAFSCDMPVLKKALPKGDAMGVGVFFKYYNHYLLSSYIYERDYSKGLSIAYHKGLGKAKKHIVSAGVQGVSVANELGYKGTNNGMPRRGRYVDIGFGVRYSGSLSDHLSVYAGYAAYNVTSPVVFSRDKDVSYALQPRGVSCIGGAYKVTSRTTLYGGAQYIRQDTTSNTLLACYSRFLLNGSKKKATNDIAIYTGAIYRHSRFVAPYVALEILKTRIGFSYDYPVNNKLDSRFANRYEVSVIFSGGSHRKDKGAGLLPQLY